MRGIFDPPVYVPSEEPPPQPEPPGRWQRLRTRLRPAGLFVAGVVAALVALLLYGALNPPAPQVTPSQVKTAVAQAMASATPPPAFSAQAYAAIQPSLVLVQTSGADSGGKATQGLGSGVVISDQGAILTALHVVNGASTIKVTFADGTQSSAQVASSDPATDIATLQPAALPQQVVPAVMGNPGAVHVGDEAYAVGNPFGLYGSLSSGVISGLGRQFKATPSGQPISGLIQIDAAVNPGNSGGPLVNRDGQVIGIVVGLLNPTENEVFVGIGFAVPINAAVGGGGPGPEPQY